MQTPTLSPQAPHITRWVPPQQPNAAPVLEHQIRVTGRLIQDAEYRMTSHGHALLTVYVGQGPDAMPWRASQRVGPDPLELMTAITKAHQLKKGALVTVWAEFVPSKWTPGSRHIHLNGVTDITEHTSQHHHTDPKATP